MCRNRVQYRSAKPERQAFGLRPARPAHPIPLPAPCSPCRAALGPRWRARQGAPVGASEGHDLPYAGLRPAPAARLRLASGIPPPAFGRVPPRASAGHPASQGIGRAARDLGGCAPGRPPTRLRRAWPLSATPRACGARPCGVLTRVPRALAGGGGWGFAPTPDRRAWARLAVGARPVGTRRTGAVRPRAARAAAHGACPTRVRARLPRPGGCRRRRASPPLRGPPSRGCPPGTPTGAGASAPAPVPPPPAGDPGLPSARRPPPRPPVAGGGAAEPRRRRAGEASPRSGERRAGAGENSGQQAGRAAPLRACGALVSARGCPPRHPRRGGGTRSRD